MKMQKICSIGLTLLFFFTIGNVYAESTRYISDQLSTYTRLGPGNNYKIAGTIKSGETVTLLGINETSQYAHIRDGKGKESWILLEHLKDTPSLHARFPQQEQKLNELTEQLRTINDSWISKTAEMRNKVERSDKLLTELRDENLYLKNQLAEAQKMANAITSQLDDKKRTIIQQWFMYGGGVAGGGLLLGLLLPHLLPRKKSNRWMN